MSIGNTYHVFETSTVDSPGLCLPIINGLSAPANQPPDSALTTGYVIPFIETGHSGPNAEQVTATQTLPIVNTTTNLVYGGELVTAPAKILPRITIEGTIDSPFVQVGEYYLPNITDTFGNRYTWAEVIIMAWEGRANANTTSGWYKTPVIWYRDPWGRYYGSPEILDFSANYVEGVPERTQFNLVLKV